MDMKEKIETYVTPDLSGFDKRIAIMGIQNERRDRFVQRRNECVER